MKYISLFLCLMVAALQLFSQQQVRIGNSDESVYPVHADSMNLSNDMENLKEFFLGKDIIGMGEATHGTHEFFELKSQMFRFLVERCNYKVFAIEASYGAELYVNDYVKGAGGSIEDAMQYLDWPWDTYEVRDLVEWIKEYNRGKPDSLKVSFYGFDMQNITLQIKYLDQFFNKENSEFSNTFREITPLLINHNEAEIFGQIQHNRSKITDSLRAISLKLQEWAMNNKPALLEKYSLKQYEMINLCIENFNQSVINATGTGMPYFFRDSCMANNVLKIKNMEGAKLFIWAHNGHVSLEYQKTLVMGSFIRKALREKYYAIGFVFDHGSFMAYKGPNTLAGAVVKFLFAKRKLYKGLMACSVESNTKNNLTNELGKTNQASFLIDLQSTSNELFTTPQYYYDIGASYMNSRRSSGRMVANKEFDALIYVSESSCTELLGR